MHDSFMPLGGHCDVAHAIGRSGIRRRRLGIYGMLVFAIVAVFISGLMVGRTPEYLGKKIGAFEMKMAARRSCFLVRWCLSERRSLCLAGRTETIFNPGPHGFSEVLYALSSAANNNGSAFAGLEANTPFYNGLLGMAMFVGRFWVMLPVLAIAARWRQKRPADRARDVADAHAAVCHSAGGRCDRGGSFEFLSGTGVGADCRTPATVDHELGVDHHEPSKPLICWTGRF